MIGYKRCTKNGNLRSRIYTTLCDCYMHNYVNTSIAYSGYIYYCISQCFKSVSLQHDVIVVFVSVYYCYNQLIVRLKPVALYVHITCMYIVSLRKFNLIIVSLRIIFTLQIH